MTIKIINDDCLEYLKQINCPFINLTVTSPPYNVDLGNNKYNKNPYDLYVDNKDHREYIQWLRHIFEQIYRLTISGGRCCINIGDGKNGAIPTSSDIIHFMVSINWIPMTHIIWDKSQCGNRCSWGSWISPSSPSFPTPFEHILVFAKRTKKLQHQGITDLTREEFMDWSLALWRFPPETRQKKIGHSAMFPIELPKRCIKMLSWVGATVFDPFAGACTTALAARELNRDCICCEISKEYCELGMRRLEND